MLSGTVGFELGNRLSIAFVDRKPPEMLECETKLQLKNSLTGRRGKSPAHSVDRPDAPPPSVSTILRLDLNRDETVTHGKCKPFDDTHRYHRARCESFVCSLTILLRAGNYPSTGNSDECTFLKRTLLGFFRICSSSSMETPTAVLKTTRIERGDESLLAAHLPPVSPTSPKMSMNTLASVPAFDLLPVYTSTVYLITGNGRDIPGPSAGNSRMICLSSSFFDSHRPHRNTNRSFVVRFSISI